MNEKCNATIIEPRELYARAIDNIDLEIEEWNGYFAGSIYYVEDMLEEIIVPLELKREALKVLYREETGEDYEKILFIHREKPDLPDANSGRPLKSDLRGGK